MTEKQIKSLQLEAYSLIEGWGKTSATNPLLEFTMNFYFSPQGIDCDYLEFDLIAAAEDHVVHRLVNPKVHMGYAQPSALMPYEEFLKDMKRVHPYFRLEVDALGIITAKYNLTQLDEITHKDRTLIDHLHKENVHTTLSTRIQNEARAFMLCMVEEIFLEPDPKALDALVNGEHKDFYTITFDRLEAALLNQFESTNGENPPAEEVVLSPENPTAL